MAYWDTWIKQTRATVNVINNTNTFPTMTSQNVYCEKLLYKIMFIEFGCNYTEHHFG